MAKKSKFKYKKRSAASVEKRSNQSGGSRDEVLKPQFQTFTPQSGDNCLRILPPTFEDAEHYGIDLHVHYQIGADKGQYLSLKKMKNEPCPIEEARAEAEEEGDEKKVKSFKASRRVLVWVIDRDKESEGPKLWSMPWTIDRDLALRSRDKRTGEVLEIDHPEEGYDVEFTKTGSGPRTKYEGIEIARRESAISDDDDQMDKWLDFITENPLPDTLIYHDYDHIKAQLAGHKPQSFDDDKKSDDKGGDVKDGGSKRSRSRSKKKEPELTREALLEMDIDEMDEICEDKDLDLFADDYKGEEEAFANAIADELDLD